MHGQAVTLRDMSENSDQIGEGASNVGASKLGGQSGRSPAQASIEAPDVRPGNDLRPEEVFAGYDLEAGILQRLRSWRDVFPALALIDALRVAGSPLYVGVFWAAVILTSWLPAGVSIRLRFGEPPRPLIHLTEQSPWWVFALTMIVIAIGALPASLAARAGACYAAGRIQSFTDNARITFSRWFWLLVIPVTPILIVAGLSLMMLVAGLVGRVAWAGPWLAEAMSIATVPLSILIGLIAGGGLVAAPLAVVAMVVEKHADPLDCLSRGYEYLFRRPVYLFFYACCSAILVTLVCQLAIVTTNLSVVIGGWGLQTGMGQPGLPTSFRWLLVRFPVAVCLAAVWGQIGAIYLLMRQVANDQEIEDIAISDVDRKEAKLES